jgi:ABC-2 type transport system permease protein
VFAGAGAVAAQLAPSARGALGVGGLALGASYLVRFVADGSATSWPKWLTPLGWAHLTRPFGDEQWGVPLLGVLAAAVLATLALLVVARRDLGAGLLPVRPGPSGAPRLRSALGLAWRLQRGLLLGWSVGFALAGVFFGTLAAGIRGPSSVVASSEPLRAFVERYTGSPTASMGEAFLWVIALTLGYTAALYPALAVLRLRAEEASGRAEMLLTAPVDRLRWAGGHLLVAALGTVVVLVAGGLSAGLTAGLAAGDVGGYVPRLLAGTSIQVPAAWMLGALTMLVFGLLPRATAAVAWTGFLFIQLFEVLGPIAGVDFRIVEFLIPYWHLPRILAGGQFTPAPLLVLSAVSAVMVLAAMAGLRRRNLPG